jgi:tetratricopeptide (TPR) repeat protein
LTLLGCLAGPVFAQSPAAAGQTLVVFPFENTSGAPGLAWIGEAFPELLGQRLSSSNLYVVGRDERLRAYDRAEIPATIHASRATLYRIAEQMDVDYAVLGQFSYDGRTFASTAQLLDMRQQKLLPLVSNSGPLPELIDVQTGLAWDLLRQLRPDLAIRREAYAASAPPVRLDAFENYVRGIIATSAPEKISHFREAVRWNPSYDRAWLQLGKTYAAERQYDQAISALSHIPQTNPEAREASFYVGLSAYYKGDFARAESAFYFVAASLPLTEIYNNLGVVSARQGKRDALQFFQRATQQDPNDADYHFNLALALYRGGDLNGASRQLHESLALRPTDTEAKSFSDRIAAEVAAKTQPTPLANNPGKTPLERIKRNYDENSFRLVALQVQSYAEQRLAKTDARTRARFHVGRGEEWLGQGFVSEAEKEFREAVSLDPANAQAHAGLARVLEDSGNVSAARFEAQSALRLKQFAEPLLVIARLDLRDNRTEAAADSINRALQLEPSNASALALKRAVAAKLAEKAQPLPNP